MRVEQREYLKPCPWLDAMSDPPASGLVRRSFATMKPAIRPRLQLCFPAVLRYFAGIHPPALLRRFRKDSRANVAIVFAVALLPVLSAIGCAVDYSLTIRTQTKLQAAADAASVAAVA